MRIYCGLALAISVVGCADDGGPPATEATATASALPQSSVIFLNCTGSAEWTSESADANERRDQIDGALFRIDLQNSEVQRVWDERGTLRDVCEDDPSCRTAISDKRIEWSTGYWKSDGDGGKTYNVGHHAINRVSGSYTYAWSMNALLEGRPILVIRQTGSLACQRIAKLPKVQPEPEPKF